MNAFFEGLFTRMPDWFFIIASIIILIGILATTVWLVLGTRKFAKSLGKEDRLFKLQAEVQNLNKENEYHENISLKLLTVIDNSRLFLNTLNSDNFHGDNIYFNVQRIIESLAADIKTRAGEKHRCGLWFPENDSHLVLLHGSSGFPDHYINNRRLGHNDSIAGRCFRKGVIINCSNVHDDHDYEKSDNDYKSLICVPVGTFGVLSIDGKKPFDESAESIAEFYAAMLETTLNHFMVRSGETVVDEVASTIHNEGDEYND